jgi:hypothetical protein
MNRMHVGMGSTWRGPKLFDPISPTWMRNKKTHQTCLT